MNHPHEQQAAAMARAGELTDGEQLRECINSGQVSAAQVVAHAENGEVTTGWPAGLLQDDSRGLSKALSRDPNARALAREAAQAATEGDDYDKFLVLENDEFDKFWNGMESDFKDALSKLPPKTIGFLGWLKRAKQEAAEREEVARLTGLLKNIRTVHGEWFGNEISSETAITYIGMYLAEDAAAPGENHG